MTIPSCQGHQKPLQPW